MVARLREAGEHFLRRSRNLCVKQGIMIMDRIISLAVAAMLAMTTIASAQTSPTPVAKTPAEKSEPVDAGRQAEPTATITHAPGDLSASSLVGAPVYNAANDRIGEVEDLIISSSGSVSAVVVGMGGFLGIGEKKVAMPFDAVRAEKGDNNALKIVIEASKDALKALPDYTYASS
jgi:sporulation protein YlmC with PRC-barrel domain